MTADAKSRETAASEMAEPSSKAVLAEFKATQCEAMAADAQDQDVRHQFLELAQQWRALAKILAGAGR